MFSGLLYNKKADLSVNVIIIAAIALIVLVVLIIVFTGRFGIFSDGVKNIGTCKSLGGECQGPDCSSDQKKIYGAMDCGKDYDGDGKPDKQGKYCCK